MKPKQFEAKLISLSSAAQYSEIPTAKIEAAAERGIVDLERRGRGRYLSTLDLNTIMRNRERIAEL